MNALEARALLFQRKLSMLNVDFSIPNVPELDNQLAVLELTPADLSNCRKLTIGKDGEVDQVLAMAASVATALVLRETKERICSDNDIEGVASWGLSVLKPLSELVDKASGASANAVADAKKNS